MRKSESTKLLGLMALTATVAFSPIAVGAPNEAGVIASNAQAVNNPGFDSNGNTNDKIVKIIKGGQPVGVPNFAGAKPLGGTNNGISYHSGPVMNTADGVIVNIVWYGDWSDTQKNLIKTMITGLSGSPYYKINTTYYGYSGTSKVLIQNIVKVGVEKTAGDLTNFYPLGKNLSDANILTLANSNLGSVSTLTLVLTDGTVAESSGFLSKYCGWHSWNNGNKFGFIGNPLSVAGCGAQTSSPNGDPGVDAMISVIAHEIVEAATDPLGTGWYDSRGYENADKCAWKFGTTTTATDGSKSNITLGGTKYLIQQNWVNAGGGYCTLSY